MNIKKQLNLYNLPNTLLVITSFPERGVKYSQNQDALAGFAKNRLLALQTKSQTTGTKIVVLTTYTFKPESYIEDGILVIRCFKRNHPLSFSQIINQIQRFNYVKNVLIEFEFATFGNTTSTLVFPMLLGTLKLLGKHVTVELHQVLDDLNKLSGHIGQNKDSFKAQVFNWGLKNFYFLLTQLADQTLVLEQELKDRLVTITGSDKISVMPHGVDRIDTKISKQKARKILGLSANSFLVLNFGYITWYKGTDLLVKAIKDSRRLRRQKVELVVAGGPSFTQGQKKHYQRFYDKTLQLAQSAPNIKVTGFVPENQLSLYFAAADLVVLPYRTFMSSSGPLSLALSFNKPFILSKSLTPYFKTADFKQTLSQFGLNSQSLTFKPQTEEIESKILEVIKDKNLNQKLSRLAKTMATKRDYISLADEYLSLVTSPATISTNSGLVLAQ